MQLLNNKVKKLHTYFTLAGLKGLHSFIHLKNKQKKTLVWKTSI